MHLYTSASNDSSTKPDLVDVEPLGQGGNEEVITSVWAVKGAFFVH